MQEQQNVPEEKDLKDQVLDTVSDVKEAAEQAWDKVEDKAEALVDKFKSGELAEEAKEKLNDLKEGAQSIWNKIVEKQRTFSLKTFTEIVHFKILNNDLVAAFEFRDPEEDEKILISLCLNNSGNALISPPNSG